ncbi:hypothetical protein [Mesorhizobium australicum]|uniref:hypothetical protein n=1 Tax=Mesorhizobium australicum TaxID=536018 RepID=UPI0012F6ADFD|nr:hypothetical protein [Mesorhizobium australicum]
MPFIVHTGSDPDGRDEVFSRGIAFGKPSNPDELVAAVEAAIAVTSSDEGARDALTANFGKSPTKKD